MKHILVDPEHNCISIIQKTILKYYMEMCVAMLGMINKYNSVQLFTIAHEMYQSAHIVRNRISE